MLSRLLGFSWELFLELSHLLQLFPLIGYWWIGFRRKLPLRSETILLAVVFALAAASDSAADLLRWMAHPDRANTWWLGWIYGPLALCAISFASRLRPILPIMTIMALTAIDVVVAVRNPAVLDGPAPFLSTFGWLFAWRLAHTSENLNPLERDVISLYSAGVVIVTMSGLMYQAIEVYPAWFAGFSVFHLLRVAAIGLTLHLLGALSLPRAAGVAGYANRVELDHDTLRESRLESLARSLEGAVGERVQGLPDYLRPRVTGYIAGDPKAPESLSRCLEALPTLQSGKRRHRSTVEKAFRQAGLPTPVQFTQLLRLAYFRVLVEMHDDEHPNTIAYRRMGIQLKTIANAISKHYPGIAESVDDSDLSDLINEFILRIKPSGVVDLLRAEVKEPPDSLGGL